MLESDKPNLDRIDPARREEVRRRIEILDRFTRSPGTKAAERAAEELGMRVSHFYTLVKAWRTKRDPAALPGAARWSGPGGRRSSLDRNQLRVIAEALSEGEDDPAERIVDRAVAKGRAADVELPTRGTIRAHVAKLRTGRVASSRMSDADLAIDHCLVDIPISTDSTPPVRPIVTTVVDLKTASMLGLALTLGPPSASTTARALLDARAIARRDRAKLLLDRPGTTEWLELAEAVEACGLETVGEVLPTVAFRGDASPLRERGNGRTVTALLGRARLGYALIVRKGPHLASPIPVRRNDVRPPMTLAEAETMLRARMRAAFPEETPGGLAPEGTAALRRLVTDDR